MFRDVLRALPLRDGESEPMMNIVSWRSAGEYISVVMPRRKHRPDCYSADGDARFVVSPGALDMAGLIITPREEDFRRLTPEVAVGILREVSLTESETDAVVERIKTAAGVSYGGNGNSSAEAGAASADAGLSPVLGDGVPEVQVHRQGRDHRRRAGGGIFRGRHIVERQPVQATHVHPAVF